MKNAYLVLSVANIRAMLHAAELEQRVRGETRESVTIVLDDITVCDKDGHITWWSINAAVERLVSSSIDELNARTLARLDLAAGPSVRDALGIKT